MALRHKLAIIIATAWLGISLSANAGMNFNLPNVGEDGSYSPENVEVTITDPDGIDLGTIGGSVDTSPPFDVELNWVNDSIVYGCPAGYVSSGSGDCIQPEELTTEPEQAKEFYCNEGSLHAEECWVDDTLTETGSPNYSCPAGFTRNGTQCRRNYTDTRNAIPHYRCDPGSTLSGNQCISEETRTTSRQRVTSGANCPSGYTDVMAFGQGWRCRDNADRSLHVPSSVGGSYVYSYSCPSGYRDDGTRCTKTVTVTENATVSHYSCPAASPAYSLSGNKCNRTLTETQTATVASYNCPAGYSHVGGGNCEKDVTYKNPAPFNLYDVCEETWTLNGGICEKTIIHHEGEIVVELSGNITFPGGDPEFEPGTEYTIELGYQQTDDGTEVTDSFIYSFTRPVVGLPDGQTDIKIPGVQLPIDYRDGGKILSSSPWYAYDGNLVDESVEVFADIETGESNLVIAGVEVAAGIGPVSIGTHDLGATDGSLQLQISTSENLEFPVQGKIRFTLGIPNSPELPVEFTAWPATATLVGREWTVQQLLDQPQFDLRSQEGGCTLITNEGQAQQIDTLKNPTCYVELTNVPDFLEYGRKSDGYGIFGTFYHAGEHDIEFKVYLFDHQGEKHLVKEGHQVVTVESVYREIAYELDRGSDSARAYIDDHSVKLRNTKESPLCDLFIDEEYVKDYGWKSRKCLIQWSEVPVDLGQSNFTDGKPELGGIFQSSGIKTVGWSISTFDPEGVEIDLNVQTAEIDVRDIADPVIDISTTMEIVNGTVLVPWDNRSYIGDFTVEGEETLTTVTIDGVSGQTVYADRLPFRGGMIYNTIPDISTDLWEATTMDVAAHYQVDPTFVTQRPFEFVRMPSMEIKPIPSGPSEVVNIDQLEVNVQVLHNIRREDGYNPLTMGEWDVRLVKKNGVEYDPMTEYEYATDGKASFSVDIDEVSDSSLRIYAQARLHSEVDGYEREVLSTVPIFITVLNGNAIGADVEVRRISGEAPFTAVYKLNLHNRLDYRAVGKVIWETSTDGGATWQEYEPPERERLQHIATYDRGVYHVRAHIFNKNSGLETYTDMVEVVAYDKPTIEIEGPSRLFVGSEQTFTAIVGDGNGPIDPSSVHIEWSLDAGTTWTHQGPEITLTRDVEERIRLYARVRSEIAPPEDTRAYDIAKESVEFSAVRGPRIYLLGPRLVELGEEYEFTAMLTLPYRGMDADMSGYFTLPDGTEVQGQSVMYAPTEEDLAKETVYLQYNAWIEGFENAGSQVEQEIRTRVWEYVWPEFNIRERLSADVAPAEVVLTVRSLGGARNLDEPVYTWELPQGVSVEEQRSEYSRAFTILEPGEHQVRLTITDARGNETIIEKVITINEVVPYEIDLQYSGSNRYDREPLDVVIRPYISGGHPRDRITKRVYSINGEEQPEAGIYGRATLDAGVNQVDLTVHSEMGQEQTGSLEINVVENQIPVCSMDIRDSGSSWYVYARCDDIDGRVSDYRWTLDGEVVSVSGRRISINKGNYETMPSITLIGIDDSGGESIKVTN